MIVSRNQTFWVWFECDPFRNKQLKPQESTPGVRSIISPPTHQAKFAAGTFPQSIQCGFKGTCRYGPHSARPWFFQVIHADLVLKLQSWKGYNI